jgi:lysophospholipase L1-like esterase
MIRTMRRPFRSAAIAALLLAATLPTSGHAAGREPLPCHGPDALLDLGQPLPRLAARLARREAVTVVALGSSSTAGAGASSPEHVYTAQLARLWPRLLGGGPVKLLNRGINGQDIDEMEKRLRADVIDQKPDLVLWQLGTNAVLRSQGVMKYRDRIGQGIAELKAAGTDVVLIDLQYAPKVLADPDWKTMEVVLHDVAAETGVGLFRRFATMKSWVHAGQLRLTDILSPDGLHQNDLGYLCWADHLGRALARAAGRPGTVEMPVSRKN